MRLAQLYRYGGDRAELESAIHKTEHSLLPLAIKMIAAGRVSFDEENPRVVRIKPERGG